MNKDKQKEITSKVPTGFEVIKREFQKDKVALLSLIILTSIIGFVFLASLVLKQSQVMRISLIDKFAAPGEGFILGADAGGRSIMGQIIIGARNSLVIGFSVTIISESIGIVIGLISGYYAGRVDNYIMRIIDFIMILPRTMITIVFITIIPKFTAFKFILVLTAFSWLGTARLIRSKALSEARRDYIQASKTLGTHDIVIIIKELLPNISSLILVDLTLTFAGNIGIETGLTFLGYGLPNTTPSLGTLISYASRPEILSSKIWIWMPASILILVLMLCINYVGQAIKRSSDAKQRLG